MPALSASAISLAIRDAFAASGEIGLPLTAPARNPRRFVMMRDETNINVWIYIWTVTPGGRSSLPNEYRIQMTTVTSPLAMNPDGPTILAGYDPNFDVFVGFDLTRHRRFTTGSPSVQVDISALQQALQNGLGFDLKGNDEIAIGVRPDHFAFYCENARDLHEAGRDSRAMQLLAKASAKEPIRAGESRLLSIPRRRVVSEVARYARAANFRTSVLQAYGNRCAVTRVQMKLVEAAHILPVAAGDESVDSVPNGIALSPTHHLAFDRALIFLDDDFSMRVNPAEASRLKDADRHAGLVEFEASLGRVHLPLDPNQRPGQKFIRLGNRFRGIKT